LPRTERAEILGGEMSARNVEIVKAMNEAYMAGDFFESLQALDPDIEWLGTKGGLDEHMVCRGHEEVINAFADNLMTWERLTLDYEKYIDAGDQVVVFVHEVARGLESGVEVETDTAVVFRLRDERVVHARGYMDRAEALEAAGLDRAIP
jgi:ketosteroid isomerase-like protein